MKSIAPPKILNQGIALFAPGREREESSFITLEIFYSRSNPIFNWVNCDNSQAKLWNRTVNQTFRGTLFLYESTSFLPAGFYTLVLTESGATEQSKKGQITLGLTEPTARLIIGLPYSIYPPISLA